jgi:hypothetical protein
MRNFPATGCFFPQFKSPKSDIVDYLPKIPMFGQPSCRKKPNSPKKGVLEKFHVSTYVIVKSYLISGKFKDI